MPGRGASLLAAAVCITCFAIGCALSARAQMVRAIAEPVYRGPEDTACVALVVNVDWGEEYLPSMLDICRERCGPA